MGLDKIDAPVVLLVEGADDEDVVNLLLDEIQPDWRQQIDVQLVSNQGGHLARLNALATVSGFLNRVKKVAILEDSDETPEKKQALWVDESQAFTQRYPGIELVFCLLPSPSKKGALESLFLQSIKPASPNFACVQTFADCVERHTPHTTQAQRDKLALISYVNSHVSGPYSRIGVAIEQDAKTLFDLKHAAFKPLVEFSESLAHV